MTQKGLLTKLGELLDEHRNEHATELSGIPPMQVARWHHWLPSPSNTIFTVVFTLAVVVGLLWAQSAGALPLAAPSATSTGTIAYQGRLADTAGQPLTGTYNMTFRLYAAASGGAPLWEETWTGPNSVQVSDGLFNVMLGSLSAIPQAVVAGNASLFLGITVGTDSEMSPRVQLGSVPFAVQALTVPDGSITKAKLASDVNLTPADGSITTTKLADGAVTSAKMSRSATTVKRSTDLSMPTANTWYDVLAHSLNLQQPTLITIQAQVGAHPVSTASVFFVEIQIDGSRTIHAERWHDHVGFGNTIPVSTSVLLQPGQHTVKVRAMSFQNDCVIVSDTRTQMTIVEG